MMQQKPKQQENYLKGWPKWQPVRMKAQVENSKLSTKIHTMSKWHRKLKMS